MVYDIMIPLRPCASGCCQLMRMEVELTDSPVKPSGCEDGADKKQQHNNVKLSIMIQGIIIRYTIQMLLT